MAVAFDDVRLPEDVEVGAHGGPAFSTTVVTFSSGAEQRNADWQLVRHSFDVGYGIGNISDFETVRAFFFARRGKWRAFRFKHWDDYNCDAEVIGTGDGVEVDFQIIKNYETSGPFPYVRDITRPVSGTVKVFKNGVLQLSGYTLNGTGSSNVHFTAAPANGVVITVTCEFDIPVRFDTDQFDFTFEGFDAGNVSGLSIIEVRDP